MNRPEFIPTRKSLLDRLKNWNDSKSWREFFDTYSRLIYGTAIKAGLTETEAEEVVQETMIAVANSMPNFHYDGTKGSFKAWLMHLTSWRITDQFRKRSNGGPGGTFRVVQRAGTTTVEGFADPASNLDRIWTEEWERNILEAAKKRVRLKANAKEYQMFDLWTNKQWSVTKISLTLGVNPAQIYRAKYRVSHLLTEEIEQLQSKNL